MNMKEKTWYAGLGIAACVGLDWAMDKHAITEKDLESGQRERCQLGNTPEAVEHWAAALAVRFGGRPVAVALEQSRGAVIGMLSKYAHLILFPVHPKTLADYRKALHPSGAKDDPTDADLLQEFLQLHGDRLRMWQPDTEATRSLQWLSEERRKFIGDRTRYGQRLQAMLQLYYPQMLQWFDDIDAPLVLDFLRRWPGLEEAKKARPATLRRFFHQHNCRQEVKIEQRIQAIATAVAATHDAAVILNARLAVTALVAQLEALHASIAAYDRQLAEITLAHPDYALMASLPGAGPVMIPRLIAAMGTLRDRYESAEEIQRCSGIAPLIERSGQNCWVHWRWACSKFMRQTFHEWASHSIASSAWAREYYQAQRDQGKGHHAAVRALAFKWIRILFRCWKDHTPYDEAKYLRALAARQPKQSPDRKSSFGRGRQPNFVWTSCNGFNKLVGLDY
jgi:transposase